VSGIFNEKGKPIKVTDGEAASREVLDGRAFAREDRPVAVINPDNKLVDIDGKDLHTSIAGGGYRLATDQEVHKTELEQKLGAPGTALGLANQFVARQFALGRGATGPGTDALATEVADLFGKKEEMKGYLRNLKEAYPVASQSHEVAGLLASLLVPGAGATKVASAAPKVARAAALAGEGMEAGRLLSAGLDARGLLGAGEVAGREAGFFGQIPKFAPQLEGRSFRALPGVAEARGLGAGPEIARLPGGPRGLLGQGGAMERAPVIEGVLESPSPLGFPRETLQGSVVPPPGGLGGASVRGLLGDGAIEGVLESAPGKLPPHLETLYGSVVPPRPGPLPGGAGRALGVGGEAVAAGEPIAAGASPGVRGQFGAGRDFFFASDRAAMPPGEAVFADRAAIPPGELNAAELFPQAASRPGQVPGAMPGVPRAGMPGVSPPPGIPGDVIARAAMPMSAIDMIGGGAEKGARALMGDGLGARIAGKAVRGGVENALIEVGAKIDESVLGEDKDLTGEKLLASAGHGAVLGAALGGAGGAAGEMLGVVRKAAANKLASSAREMLIDSLNPTPTMRKKIAKLGNEDFAQVMLEFTEAGGKTSDIAPKAKEALEGHTDEMMRAYGGIPGPKLGDVVRDVRNAMLGRRVRGEEYRHLADLLKQENFLAGDRARVEKFLADVDLANPKTALDWHEQIQKLGVAAKYEGKNPTAAANAFRDIRSIFQDAMFEAGDAAAKKAGSTPWSEGVKAANKRFQHLKLLSELTERQSVSSKEFSFVEKFLIPMAFWSTGPLGIAKGMAASVIINQGRQRAAGMAHILDKMAGIGALKKAAANVDAAVDDSVVAFFANTKPTVKFRVYDSPDEPKGVKERFMHRMGILDRVQASPRAMQDGLSRTFGGIGRTAPMTNAALTAASLRAVDYLRKSAPPVTISPIGVRQAVTDADMRAFNRKWDAVDDPVGVLLGGLASGSLSPDHVAAVSASHPKWIEDVRHRIITTVATQQAEGKSIPKQKLMQLSILFDAKLDSSIDLTPKLQEQMKPQQAAKKKAGGGSPGGSFNPSKMPTFSSMYSTDAQRRQTQRR
jgi:hypothetical protein